MKCGKFAFESVMKIVCEQERMALYNQTDTSSVLLKTVLSNIRALDSFL